MPHSVSPQQLAANRANEIGMTGSATPDNENTPQKQPRTFNNLRVFPEEPKP